MRLIQRVADSWHLNHYLDYLEQNAGTFPLGARNFALAHWHYDFKHKQCPHDSWLQELIVRMSTISSGEELSSAAIHSTYLGAYHDGYHEIEYKQVSSYTIDMREMPSDWVIDEVTLENDGRVCHEIVFAEGTLIVRCQDLLYRWTSGRSSSF